MVRCRALHRNWFAKRPDVMEKLSADNDPSSLAEANIREEQAGKTELSSAYGT